ncbi:MAG: F0F1 ATP synthase subunit delta [Candidatus Microsaccharimonas sp.]
MARKLSRRSLALYVADQLVTQPNHNAVVKRLAGYLVESRRTKELDIIVKDIDYYLSEKGIMNTVVTSAFDIGQETKKAIEQFVLKQTNANTIALSNEVDPTVIGGVRISLPGRELDQTIAHQLTVLKTRFKKA